MKKYLLTLAAVAVMAVSANAKSVSFYSPIGHGTSAGSNVFASSGFLVPLGVDNYQVAFNTGVSFGGGTVVNSNSFIGLAGIPVPYLNDFQTNIHFANTSGKLKFAGVNLQKTFAYEIVKNVEVGAIVNVLSYTATDRDGRANTTFALLGDVAPVVQVKLLEL